MAEWFRCVPVKYMGFPHEISNLSSDNLLKFSPFIPLCLTPSLHFFYFSMHVVLYRSAFKQILVYAARLPHSAVAADKEHDKKNAT